MVGTANIVIGNETLCYENGTYTTNELLIHDGVNTINFAEGSSGQIYLTYRSGVF